MEGPIYKSRFIQILKNGWNCNDVNSERVDSVIIRNNLDQIPTKIFFVNQELRNTFTNKHQIKDGPINKKTKISNSDYNNYFDILGHDDD